MTKGLEHFKHLSPVFIEVEVPRNIYVDQTPEEHHDRPYCPACACLDTEPPLSSTFRGLTSEEVAKVSGFYCTGNTGYIDGYSYYCPRFFENGEWTERPGIDIVRVHRTGFKAMHAERIKTKRIKLP